MSNEPKTKTVKAATPSQNSQRRAALTIPQWLERGQRDWSNIRFLRRLARISQPEMAWLLGKYIGNIVDISTISTYENNRRNPPLEMLNAYSKVFKVPVMCLFVEIVPLSELKGILVVEGDWEAPIFEQVLD